MLDACGWRFGRAKRNTMGLRAHPDAMAPDINPLPIHFCGWSCQLVHNLHHPRGYIFHNSVLLPHISRYSLPSTLWKCRLNLALWYSSPKLMTPSSCIPFAFACVWDGRRLLVTLHWQCSVFSRHILRLQHDNMRQCRANFLHGSQKQMDDQSARSCYNDSRAYISSTASEPMVDMYAMSEKSEIHSWVADTKRLVFTVGDWLRPSAGEGE